jgi:hypothetical protein
MDPEDINDDYQESEYGWGPGLFQPGIAENEGQKYHQDDFGDNMIPQTTKIGSADDNYARAVADRRTDPTDPESTRDFEALGNPDRYGGQPPLVRAPTRPNDRVPDPFVERKGVDRKW